MNAATNASAEKRRRLKMFNPFTAKEIESKGWAGSTRGQANNASAAPIARAAKILIFRGQVSSKISILYAGSRNF